MQKSIENEYFTHFKTDVSEIALPNKFTFPFFYEPHQLCEVAAKELQATIEANDDWKHNFGLENKHEVDKGKMFGVLVVQSKDGTLGYLKGYSGKLYGMDRPFGFVPNVFDLPKEDNFYDKGMGVISKMNHQIKGIKKSQDFLFALNSLKTAETEAEEEISGFKRKMLSAKKDRKEKRKALSEKDQLSEKEEAILVKQSLQYKYRYRVLKQSWKQALEFKNEEFEKASALMNQLKERRKELSAALQQRIFDEYQFLNAKKEWRSLDSIFRETDLLVPPAGAGDCAAPKLLQAAYVNGFKPVAMAEFWWGESPSMEIKKHKAFYPACRRKCKPILGHMLQGLNVDDNPLLINYGEGKVLDKVFEDEHLLVVNKPYGLLSVPGKDIEDSVYSRMIKEYPEATGPVIVHRLDQDTSGLMLIAKSKDVHKNLQEQFLDKSIQKRYVAILDGEIEESEGMIHLPLRVDINNRPMQVVCYEHGKRAITRYRVLGIEDGKTRMSLFPITGRSHQLRMHCAHKDGLGISIVGDNLYGKKADRLYLHAEHIKFRHPVLNKTMRFEAKAQF